VLSLIVASVLAPAAPVPIAPSIPGAIEPQAAFLSDGRLAVAFGTKSSLYVAVETPEKDGFQSPVLLSNLPGLAIGMRRGPRIAVAGSNLVVTASFPTPEMTRGRDFQSFVSGDQGKTWRGPYRVNDAPGSAPEGLHGMCSLANGDVACDWLDLRNARMEIFSAISKDGGKSWSKNSLVYRSPDGNVCECCHPSVAADPKGGFVALWRNSLAGNRDMYWCSTRDGRTFSEARMLGASNWQLRACPMDGGAVASSANGLVLSVWRRQGTVYLSPVGTYAKLPARMTEGENLLGRGEQPWVAMSGDRLLVVWLERRRGRLRSIGTGQGTLLSENADDPVAVAGPNGVFAVVWSEPGGPKAMRL